MLEILRNDLRQRGPERTMEYFPKELDYKSANFGAMCKRPPNPFERHLNEDGFRGDHIMWERRIAPGKAKDGAKDEIPSRGGWFAGGEYSHVDDQWHIGQAPEKKPAVASPPHNQYGLRQIFHTVPSA